MTAWLFVKIYVPLAIICGLSFIVLLDGQMETESPQEDFILGAMYAVPISVLLWIAVLAAQWLSGRV